MLNYIKQCRSRFLLAKCLSSLAKLQQAFFVNYLKKDYIKRQLSYQKKFNLARKQFFKALLRAERDNNSRYQAVLIHINHLGEIIFSLNQLRLRVTDYSTFQVCVRELAMLERFSVKMLFHLRALFFKSRDMDFSDFEIAIHQFEDIYNRTLQIVALDPFVFMFFIQDLYAFLDEGRRLQQAILQIK